jgi:hypothetical protein
MSDNDEINLLDDYRVIFNLISLKAKNLHAVLCKETGRIVCFTNWFQTAKEIECDPSLRAWYFINHTKLIPSNVNLNTPYEVVFDNITGAFFVKEITQEEVNRFIVISEKAAVLDTIHRTISEEHDYIRSDLSLQEHVYQKKYEEALEVISGGFDREKHIYICFESNEKNINPVKLARAIIDKRNFAESKLFHMEQLRVKYTNMLKQCNNLLKVNEILDEFNRESSIYGRF